MLKHLRDFFKTLKMEVFGAGVEEEDLLIGSAVLSEDVDIKEPEVGGFEVEVVVEEGSIGGNAEVKGFRDLKEDVEVLKGGFGGGEVDVISEDLKASTETSETPLNFPSEIKREDLGNLEVSVERTGEIHTSVVKGDAPPLWTLTLKRSTILEKDKVLDALARLLRRYGGRPEGMEFLGYFKGVPIGSAEALLVEKGRLVLRISKRRRRNVVADLVAIKTPRGIMVEVVR